MRSPDRTALSGTAISAPSFVAAALGEPAPSHVRVQKRTLYVARAGDAPPAAVICGLADEPGGPRLLPPGSGPGYPADLVLAVADGTPRDPLTRRRNPAAALAGMLRRLVWHKFGLVFGTLLAVAIVGFVLLRVHHATVDSLYLTVMDMTGAAFTGPGV